MARDVLGGEREVPRLGHDGDPAVPSSTSRRLRRISG